MVRVLTLLKCRRFPSARGGADRNKGATRVPTYLSGPPVRGVDQNRQSDYALVRRVKRRYINRRTNGKAEDMDGTIHARPLRQKIIGILGGMSNQATGEYYRLLNERLNSRFGGWDNGEIIIASVNFGNIQYFVREGRWDEAAAYLEDRIQRLEAAGVDVIACVSNTMHRVAAPAMAKRSTPFIHIADPTGEAMRRAGVKRVALLGTMPVMDSEALRTRYRENFGVEVIAPNNADKTVIDRIIFDELVRGALKPESKAQYIRIVEAMRADGAEGVILGCIEIFLLVGQADFPGFPVFDTTALHVEAIVDFACG